MKLKSFKSYNESRVNTVVLTFGRFSPPTIGHEKVISKVSELASGNNYRIYSSQAFDNNKNPIPYSDKIKFLRKMFPKHGRNIIEDRSIKHILDALVQLTEQGYTKAIIVVGSDRVNELRQNLPKYNGVSSKHGLYEFRDGIEIISSGERDGDSDDVKGMSATKMRNAAITGDFETFKKGLPSNFADALQLFNSVRNGLGHETINNPRKHVQLESVSETREAFVKGELFKVGDRVLISETKEECIIKNRGPNFVLVETNDGKQHRKWLHSIEHKNG